MGRGHGLAREARGWRFLDPAGVVPGAFYRHFASMDELGLALVEESVQTLRAMLREAREDQARRANPDHLIARSVAILVEHVRAGRSAEARPPNAKELAGTLVLKVPLAESSAKIRTGPPVAFSFPATVRAGCFWAIAQGICAPQGESHDRPRESFPSRGIAN